MPVTAIIVVNITRRWKWMKQKNKLPATEQLINEDGVLDEKAAGAAIDKVIEQTKKENIETLKENTQPTSDEKKFQMKAVIPMVMRNLPLMTG